LTASSEAEDSLDSTPPARPLRSMQTGQNSIAPENSLPQLGQVRWGSGFMDLTVPQPQFEWKPTARSTGRREIGQLLTNCCSVAQAIACCVILSRQITFRNRIPTVGVLQPPLRWFETSSHKSPTFEVAANRLVCQTFAGYLPSFGAFGLVGTPVLQFLIFAAYGTE
jgi:hypothetical protein